MTDNLMKSKYMVTRPKREGSLVTTMSCQEEEKKEEAHERRSEWMPDCR